MCGTAAAASSRSTVMRTISEPVRASAATCCAVPFTSAVSVLVIDCTTMGAPPPTLTWPTFTATVLCRSEGAADWVILGNVLLRPGVGSARGGRQGQFRGSEVVIHPAQVAEFAAGPPTAMTAHAGDLAHAALRREARALCRRVQAVGHRRGGRLADRAAFLADQKNHRCVARVIVDAGEERVAAFDAMH